MISDRSNARAITPETQLEAHVVLELVLAARGARDDVSIR
jgi:hypothetical protein